MPTRRGYTSSPSYKWRTCTASKPAPRLQRKEATSTGMPASPPKTTSQMMTQPKPLRGQSMHT
jgi:hypothetical protein